jgi:hypothetical protein
MSKHTDGDMAEKKKLAENQIDLEQLVDYIIGPKRSKKGNYPL